MKPDVLSLPRIIIQSARMRIVLKTEHQLGFGQPTQERQEDRRAIQVKKERRLFLHRIIADAASLLVTGNVIAIQLSLDVLRLRNQGGFNELARQKLWNDQELVLIPIVPMQSINIQFGDSLVGRLSHRA